MSGARPLLTFTDPVPGRDRVGVCGVTGVGKSTVCRQLSTAWNLPYTELDALHHGPGWTQRETFAADVGAIAASPRWVSELQYMRSGPGWQLADRMQTLLWLDYPRRIARTRLFRRTVARAIDHRELWPGTGNIEPPLWHVFTSPDHILRWEMRTHRKWRDELIPELRLRRPDLDIIRFGRPAELATWLEHAGGV